MKGTAMNHIVHTLCGIHNIVIVAKIVTIQVYVLQLYGV